MNLATNQWYTGFELDATTIKSAEADAAKFHTKVADTVLFCADILERQKASLGHGCYEAWVTNALGITTERAAMTVRCAGVLRRADSPALMASAKDLKALSMLSNCSDEALDAAVEIAETTGKLRRVDVRQALGLAPVLDQKSQAKRLAVLMREVASNVEASQDLIALLGWDLLSKFPEVNLTDGELVAMLETDEELAAAWRYEEPMTVADALDLSPAMTQSDADKELVIYAQRRATTAAIAVAYAVLCEGIYGDMVRQFGDKYGFEQVALQVHRDSQSELESLDELMPDADDDARKFVSRATAVDEQQVVELAGRAFRARQKVLQAA